MDALSGVDIVREGASGPTSIARDAVALRGLAPGDAILPEHPSSHEGHRLVAEFATFPEKFRFVDIDTGPGPPVREIVLRFSRRVPVGDDEIARGFSANRVPVVNLWPAAGAPFELTGRALEYPLRADSERHRTVECHSVKVIELLHGAAGGVERIDPIVATARRSPNRIQWGTRRRRTRTGAEVVVFFRGLDYNDVGRERLLVASRLLASNGHHAETARAGARLEPSTSLGGWTARLVGVPTPYRAARGSAQAVRTLCAHLRTSIRGLCVDGTQGALRTYLREIPGAPDAPWVDAIHSLSVRGVIATRERRPCAATRVVVGFDPGRAPGTSLATLEAVLRRLFDAHRRLNAIEEVRLGVG